ncbi:hypothetical protein XELAEV_18030733mg [Xenopus laevis]|uniref:Uncharacterized protein n=1 Tax=Xenopus laevis TaxID=8355 RepID=A0A974CMJ3_XENLA|nr:hypothetical protein XELAEV_18030733mg [Xenopus laevis]
MNPANKGLLKNQARNNKRKDVKVFTISRRVLSSDIRVHFCTINLTCPKQTPGTNLFPFIFIKGYGIHYILPQKKHFFHLQFHNSTGTSTLCISYLDVWEVAVADSSVPSA